MVDTNINRYVGVEEEAEFGVEGTPITTAFDLADGLAAMALDSPKDPNIPLPTLSRFQKRHAPGFYAPAGTMEYSGDVNTIGWFLKWVLGGYKFTAGTVEGPNTHEFYSTQGYGLNSFTTRVGKDTFEHVFLGSIINKLDLTIDKDLLTGKLDMIAQQDKKEEIRTTLNEPDQDIFPLAFYDHTIHFDSDDVSDITKAWAFSYDNGIKADDGQGQGSRFPYLFRAAAGTAGLKLTMKSFDSSLLEKYWGDTSGPGTEQIPFMIEDDFDSGDFGSMNVKFPRCTIATAPSDIKGADPRIPALDITIESDNISLLDTTTTVDTPVLVTILNYEDEYNLPTVVPVAAFTGTPLTGVHPITIAFTNTTVGSRSGYLWDFGDETSGSTVKNPVHTYDTAGTYTVTLTATNAAGEDVETQMGYIIIT